jgi:hypothetical protein
MAVSPHRLAGLPVARCNDCSFSSAAELAEQILAGHAAAREQRGE